MVIGARRCHYLQEMEKGSDNSVCVGCRGLNGGKDSSVVALAWAMVIENGQLGSRLSFSWMIESLDLSGEVCGRVS